MKERKHEVVKSIESGIGGRVMEFRKLVNLSQLEFSQKLDATQAGISQIEAGKCLPSGHFIVKLLEVFPDVNLHWLFLGIEDPFRIAESPNASRFNVAMVNKLHEINLRMKDFHENMSDQVRSLIDQSQRNINM